VARGRCARSLQAEHLALLHVAAEAALGEGDLDGATACTSA
jgi:hypothetical protein